MNQTPNLFKQFESSLTNIVAGVAPWIAPLPTAYLVGRATITHLAWPGWVGVISALIIESLGLASTSTALLLYEYNQEKRKSDPAAPFWLAAILVGIYFAVATGLTVLLDIWPTLAGYAPAIFPLLSLTGVTCLALRGDHRRRITAIQSAKMERKISRLARQTGYTPDNAPRGGFGHVNQVRKLRKDERLLEMLRLYKSDPQMGATEMGQHIGVHRNTVYGYLDELEEAEKIRRNGHGVEVLL